MNNIRTYADRTWPVFLALGVPVSAFGPAPLAVAMVLVFLALLTQHHFRQAASDLLADIRNSYLSMAVVILMVLWAMSASGSLDVEKSFTTLARVFLIVGLLTVISRTLSVNAESLVLFQKASLVFSIAVLIYAAAVLALWDGFFAPVQALKGDHLTGPHFFKSHASTAVVFLPFLLWSGWSLGGQWRHLGFSAAVLTLILIYGGGREVSFAGLAGVIGAVVAAGFILLVGSVKRAVSYLFWLTAVVLFVAVAWYVATSLPEPPYDDQMPNLVPFIDSHRELIWSFVLEAHKAAPWFGYGPNAVNNVAGAGTVIEALNQEYIPSHPHNWMIEVLAETGWIGFSALLACLALHLRQIIRGLYIDKPAALALAGCSGAFWVSGLVNFSFWTTWWQISYLLALVAPFACVMIAKSRNDRSRQDGC